MQQNNKKVILIILILIAFLFPLYYLSDYTVYNNQYYLIITVVSVILVILILLLNRMYYDAITEKIILTKKENKLDFQNRLFIYLRFYGNKIAFVLGFLFVSFYIVYSMFNFIVYIYSLNSDINDEIVKIDKIEMYKNNIKYEFYFKNEVVSKRTSMTSLNRDILDGKKKLDNYAIHIYYKKSLPNTYYIIRKEFIDLNGNQLE